MLSNLPHETREISFFVWDSVLPKHRVKKLVHGKNTQIQIGIGF